MSTKKNVLLPKVIICGYERGGTTLLSEWIRSAGYFSYFEIGSLLFSNSKNFSKKNVYLDGLKRERKNDMVKIDYTSHESIYNSIFQGKNHTKFFDKTPRYMSILGDVIGRSTFCNKYIVITRDPRNVFYSWAKRQEKSQDIAECIKTNLRTWSKRYITYYYGCISYIEDGNVLFIKHEDLCLNPIESKKILEWFLNEKISINSIFNNNRSYSNVDKGINSYKAFDGISNITASLQKDILEQTKVAAPFFLKDLKNKSHIKNWYTDYIRAKTLIDKFGLKNHSEWVKDKRIDPLFYYLYHDDIRKVGANALVHFKKTGLREKRLSYKVDKSF